MAAEFDHLLSSERVMSSEDTREPHTPSSPQVGDEWYRYRDVQYAPPLDEWDNPIPGAGRVAVELDTFYVTRVTPKGVWLSFYKTTKWSNTNRFQRSTATKQFACPTLEEAKISFIARKRRQRGIYQARLTYVDKCLSLIEKL